MFAPAAVATALARSTVSSIVNRVVLRCSFRMLTCMAPANSWPRTHRSAMAGFRFWGRASPRSASLVVGCDKEILWPSVGLQSGLIGTDWSSLALLRKKIHRQDLTEEVRAAGSILQACEGSEAGSFSNLVWRGWSLMQRDSCKTRNGTQPK